MIVLVVAATFGQQACASTSESRLRREIFMDIYWTASKKCEARHHTLRVERIGLDGSLSVEAAAGSRIDAQPFRECYWKTVEELAEHRRAQGLPLPEETNLRPDVDFD
jgi:hypothetical protein